MTFERAVAVDARAFDRLTRLLSLAGSRRVALRSMVAAGFLGVVGADAKGKGKGRKNTSKCPKKAKPHRCGKTCTNKNTDAQNCGTCGNPCFEGEACSDGVCSCGPGMVVCGGVCAEGNCCDGDAAVTCDSQLGQSCCAPNGCKILDDDAGNCGVCGVICTGTSNKCVNKSCVCGSESGACTGGEVCDENDGCTCGNSQSVAGCGPCPVICFDGRECIDDRCSCKDDEIFYEGNCHVCPDPPGIGLPGNDHGFVCPGEPDDYCSCGRECCDEPDDCFVIYNGAREVVDEFCCKGTGRVVCGDLCCDGEDCEKGCIRQSARSGSYRRPGR